MLQKVIGVGILLLLVVCVVQSKAPLSKILIAGGKLSEPLEVTDPGILGTSNPWFGSFIPQWNQGFERGIAEPPNTTPRYELSFYATFSQDAPHIIYVAYYAFDPSTHRGFVYLPGHNEQWYFTNSGSILRPHQDGHWNLANGAWSENLNSIIARSEQRY